MESVRCARDTTDYVRDDENRRLEKKVAKSDFYIRMIAKDLFLLT